MKKFLLPAMFVIALAGSAFTRFSNSKAAHKDFIQAYYVDNYGDCQSYQVFDDNCVVDPLNYFCYENVIGSGWYLMLQTELGNTCWQPYYSYYSNCPSCE